MMPCFVHARTDPFYEERLSAGKAALLAHDGAEAADQLRIAAFGLLEAPRHLSEALAWLTLAHHGLGHDADAAAVLDRFMDGERRNPAYQRSLLPPEVREVFEKLLLARFGRDSIAAIPSLAPLVGAAPPSAVSPAPPKEALSPGPPRPTPAARPAPASTGERATTLLRAGKPAEAVTLLTAELSRNPDQRRLRILLLEAACLSSRWRVAAEQARALAPIADSEPVALFYAAVSLYETNDAAGARQLLDRALPRVTQTPFVQRYRRMIQGAQPGR